MDVQKILTERQREGLSILCEPTKMSALFGGSRSGKTVCIATWIFLLCLIRPSRHLILRKHLASMRSAMWHGTLPKVLDLLEIPSSAYKFKGDCSHIKFANGADIWMGGLDNINRADKILGNEYSTIWINEASEFDADSIPNLMSRLAENVGIKNKLIFDFNPPETSHWTYDLIMHKKLITAHGESSVNINHLLLNPGDNIENLPSDYVEFLESMPERQRQRFLLGIFVSPDEAIFKQEMIKLGKLPPAFEKGVVGIDPATTNKLTSDETGIFSMGRLHDVCYQIADLTIKASPDVWAFEAIDEYLRLSKMCRDVEIAAEVNQGGDMVGAVIKNAANNMCSICQARRIWSQDNTTFTIKKGDPQCMHRWGIRVKYQAMTTHVSKEYRAEAYSIMLALDRWIFNEDADFKLYIRQLLGYTNMLENKKSPDRVDAAIIAACRINQNKRSLLYFQQ